MAFGGFLSLTDRRLRIAAGSKTPEFCEPPGIREGGGVQLYLAYLVDPSGNKICAMYRIPK